MVVQYSIIYHSITPQVQAVLASTAVMETEDKSQGDSSYKAPASNNAASSSEGGSYAAPPPILAEPNWRPSRPQAPSRPSYQPRPSSAAIDRPSYLPQPPPAQAIPAGPSPPLPSYGAPPPQAGLPTYSGSAAQPSYRPRPAQAQATYGAPVAPASPAQASYGLAQEPSSPAPPPPTPGPPPPAPPAPRPSYRLRPPKKRNQLSQVQKFLCLFWCYLDQEENETHWQIVFIVVGFSEFRIFISIPEKHFPSQLDWYRATVPLVLLCSLYEHTTAAQHGIFKV